MVIVPASVSVAPAASLRDLRLAQARPNPARGTVSIDFTLPRRSDATLRVYDVAGRLLRTVTEGPFAAGPHTAAWDGREASGAPAAAGVYFYELCVGGQRLARRVVILR